jgi:hypothetical protein
MNHWTKNGWNIKVFMMVINLCVKQKNGVVYPW